jgi:hypothetical protein
LTSNRAKGNRHEQEVADILSKEGYLVYRASPAIRFIGPGRFVSGQNDIFGCADLLAKSPGETILIQVTSRENASTRKRKMEQALKGFCGERDNIQVWSWGKDQRHGYAYAVETAVVEATEIGRWSEPIYRKRNGEFATAGL